MADGGLSGSSGLPNLNLTAEEKQLYGRLFKAADPDGFDVVSGDVAVKFFEKTKLPADVLGQIWQIADTENRGLLTPAGFGVVLRLIGHAQAGRAPSLEVASQPGPLPRFDGFSLPPAPQPAPTLTNQSTGTPTSPTQPTGAPIRVPPLAPEKVNEYASLFEKSGAENGVLNGGIAKQIFERARLPNEVLGRIWNLADTQARGSLDTTEFIIAMHLLASYKSGAMRGLPNTLPPGLYEAAARRGGSRTPGGPRPGPVGIQGVIPPQFSGQGRPQSPATRQFGQPLSAQSTGEGWLVTPADKARFDQIFASVDTTGQGFVTGDQAVEFFSNSRLPEDILASIWDLADIHGEGRLNKDEFAVAMYLIRQQRGTKDGRGALPTTLPLPLIPPSMRRQNIQPTQPTAPAFDNAPNITQPKSAADDLFGLDAFSSSPPLPQQAAQTTGGSAVPFQAPSSPPPATQPSASTSFKPFIPSSTFGQSIIPQSTGSPAPTTQPRAAPSAADDLLGDADPEVSNKLTQETTELANLSNQVGTLSKQMQEVQGSRVATDQQLSQSTQQKREFETRLSQLRNMYEKEVKDVKALEERLTASRNETRKLQQELAMIDGSYQDLRNQHQQLSAQVETEQRESATLKDKLRQMNAEVSALKPAVEKLKSDARQQKGLNAINRKQLATVEGERDRLQGEHTTATKELQEARAEAQAAATPPASVNSPPPVSSPAASVTSQNNPFFRRQASGLSESGLASPAVTRSIDPRNTFDSVFGPSVASSSTPPPTTSFRSDSPAPAVSTNVIEPSPSGSPPPSTFNETPRVIDPPAPPASRQITSSALPLQHKLEREDSVSSSVKVMPPASRLGAGDTPRIGTPSASVVGDHSQAGSSPVEIEKSDVEGSNAAYFGEKAPVNDVPFNAAQEHQSTANEIPGAFPAATPLETPAASREVSDKKPEDGNFDEFFGGPAQSHSEKTSDFDQAFADMRAKEPQANGSAATPTNKEFPPIQEFGDDDDDDDSEDEPEKNLGFDDNFAPAAAQQQGSLEVPPTQPDPLEQQTTGSAASLPSADAQPSPPKYNEAVTAAPDQFPRQYSGLLPHREDPTSPTEPIHSVDSATGAPVERQTSRSYGPESNQSPSQSLKSPLSGSSAKPAPANNLDFDSAFANMNMQPAQPAEESDDDDFEDSFATHNQNTEFDPTFDSPAASTHKTAAPPTHQASSSAFDDFDNFGSNIAQNNATSGTAPAPTSNTSHDWDAIFASLDGPGTEKTLGNSNFPEVSNNTEPPQSAGSTLAAPQTSTRPELGRALSAGTEHDDPILKRLTGMGYPRDESLKALEKFDYNLDKAADYLTSRS